MVLGLSSRCSAAGDHLDRSDVVHIRASRKTRKTAAIAPVDGPQLEAGFLTATRGPLWVKAMLPLRGLFAAPGTGLRISTFAFVACSACQAGSGPTPAKPTSEASEASEASEGAQGAKDPQLPPEPSEPAPKATVAATTGALPTGRRTPAEDKPASFGPRPPDDTRRTEAGGAGDTSTKLVEPLSFDLQRWRAWMGEVPEVSRFADDFVPFDRRSINAAMKRGNRSRRSITAWTFAPAAFAWRPASGEEFWIVSGKSGQHTLLAALTVVGRGHLKHAGSTVFDEPDTSVAIGYAPDKPDRLLWTTCFGCQGESGNLVYQGDGRVHFTYR